MIDLEKVVKRYGPGAPAVDQVNLSVGRGEFAVVVGGSGSGKTTLLKMINRLIDCDEGEVRVDGRRVTEARASDLRRRIGYVFQGVGLFPHLSVAENIAITPRLLGWSRARRAARVAELLRLVDLPQEVAPRAPDALSGGQRQRIGLARALAAGPEVMLLDEPFGALDALTRDVLGREYRAIHDRLGLTTVMITHDMLEALILADRIHVMRSGRLIASGTPAEILVEDDPYVSALVETPRRQAALVNALAQGAGG